MIPVLFLLFPLEPKVKINRILKFRSCLTHLVRARNYFTKKYIKKVVPIFACLLLHYPITE